MLQPKGTLFKKFASTLQIILLIQQPGIKAFRPVTISKSIIWYQNLLEKASNLLQ